MNRDEAINVAIQALHYVLDNDYEYLTPEAEAVYQQALNVLSPQPLITESSLYLVTSDDDDPGPVAA